MTKPSLWQLFKKGVIITIGCLIYAISINLFFVPANLNTGGLTGIALIFNTLWNLPVGLSVFFLNLPVILLAIRFIGFRYIVWTLYATVVSSLLIDLTVPLEGLLALGESDSLLFCIFGGVVCGAGLGIVYTQDASTGGTDVISRLIQLVFPHMTMGRLMLICDLIIVAAGAMILGDPIIALYSIVAIYLSSGAIDTVLYGLEKSQMATIVTTLGDQVCSRLLEELNRGVTRIPSLGGYSGSENETLLCAISARQMSKVQSIVSEVDPNAFVIFSPVHDIMGDGFPMRFK
ncbi:MAG: YitT family protein [Ruminococcaceae bacterium]|nr:YitT family protein [Oscillospiraceae bacterium]